MDYQIIVQNIERLCKEKGIDETPLCRDSGAGQNFMQDLKAGKNVAAKRLQLVAKRLGVTTSMLMGEEMPTPEGGQKPDRYDELTPEEKRRTDEYIALLFAARQKD